MSRQPLQVWPGKDPQMTRALQEQERKRITEEQRIEALAQRGGIERDAPTRTTSGQLAAGEWGKFDTTSSALTALLPAPTFALKNRSIWVTRTNAAGSALTVKPVSGFVNGTTSVTATAQRCLEFTCDGEGWWQR